MTGAWLTVVVLMTMGNVLGYEVISVRDGASMQGTVRFLGTPPTAEPVIISKDQEVCGKTEKRDESLVVSDNHGVQNAVVSLVNIERGKRFSTTKAVVDQKDCRYAPHVLLTPIGDVTFLNSDGILHNIHSHSSKNPPFNKAQPKFKKSLKETFREPEVIKITCDAHAWMSGWLVIQDHPYYAVTDAKGQFLLEDIPPGDYEIKVWHEVLAEKVHPIRLSAKEQLSITVELTRPHK
jgi:plastocyanin